MSSFTVWNGPPGGRGPNTKDVLALIDAYNALSAALSKHLESTVTDGVHDFDEALDNAVTQLTNALNTALAGKADADGLAALEEKVAPYESAIAQEVSRAQAAENTIQLSVANEASRAANAEAEINDAIDELEAALNSFKETFDAKTAQVSFDDEETLTTIEGIVEATEALIGKIKARELIDFIEWTEISAQYAGTGTNDGATKTNGIYILGRLSEEWDPDKGFSDEYKPKAARAYIKYINDRPFDLIVDMTASGGKNGAITVTASFDKPWTAEDEENAWEDVCLHLLTNTDSSGSTHVYLGISARGLSGQSVNFHIAGVNFIAGGTVNGIVTSLGYTRVEQGFNANRAKFDDLRVYELHDPHGDPILKVNFTNYTTGAQKELFIADSSFYRIYFMKRPYVFFEETDEDGNSEVVAAPVLTSRDLDALNASGSFLGIIVFWPKWEEATVTNGNGESVTMKRASGYPSGWLACDGSTINLSDYDGLAEALGETGTTYTLPVMDYAIMRVKGLFDDVELEDGDVEVIYDMTQVSAAITELQEDLADEAETREANDNALQANIEAEAQARQEADSNLQTNINAETNARIEADNNLQTNINAETNARIEADNSLQTNINAETNARIEADDNLQTNINAETNARVAADEALQAAIDAEAQARGDADTALQENIDAEAAARQEADEDLQEQIDNAHWTGSADEFEAAIDGLADGTIVLSPDDLNHIDDETSGSTEGGEDEGSD